MKRFIIVSYKDSIVKFFMHLFYFYRGTNLLHIFLIDFSGQAKLVKKYVRTYFGRVPLDELVREAPAALASMVCGQLEFLQLRSPGETLIRVFNPRTDVDGWESGHTIIEMVNDDMSFLVDTATVTLAELGLGVHLITHPVMWVKRDDNGKLVSLYLKKKKLGKAESIMQFQIDRRTGEGELLGH